MKQFGKILKFELKNHLANKVFISVTIILVLIIAAVMFYPRVKEIITSEDNTEISAEGSTDNVEVTTDSDKSDNPLMLVVCDSDYSDEMEASFSAAFTDYNVEISDITLSEVKDEITSGEAECAFVIEDLTTYTYYVNNLSMYDYNTSVANELLQNINIITEMTKSGISAEEAQAIITKQISADTQIIGKDQMKNYFYTYIMIFALYMVILLYGQMVASNVASEKSSRAMELLITSAKPTSMMFGKVIASCITGLIQLVAIFGSAFVFFNLNKEYWDASGIVSSIFDIPISLLVYMLVFFVLGFLLYAFLYGAVGSTASKLEDINTSVMPITMIFIIAFIVIVISLSSNNVDTLLIKACSFIPFTSPMAMFTRIAMSTVPWYEIVISIGILILSVIGIGILSAKIYRIGVLLYGTPPKLGAILKAIKKA